MIPHRILAWWTGLGRRERVLTTVAAAAVMSGLIYSIAIEPATGTRAEWSWMPRPSRKRRASSMRSTPTFASGRTPHPTTTSHSESGRAALVRPGPGLRGSPRSIQEECLDRVVPLGEAHLRKLVREYVSHYHEERPHQGLGGKLVVPSDRPSRNGPFSGSRSACGS